MRTVFAITVLCAACAEPTVDDRPYVPPDPVDVPEGALESLVSETDP